MKSAPLKLAIVFFLAISVCPVVRADSESRSPKLSLRFTNTDVSLLQGTKTGGFLSVGGLEAQFLYYFTSRFAAGIDYHVDFDFGNHNIIFNGFDVFGRYYWWGQGTRTRTEELWGVVENRSRVSWYAMLALTQRAYHPSANSTTTAAAAAAAIPSSNGSFTTTLGIGTDLRLNRKVDLNLEFGTTLSNFASDPTAVQYTLKFFNIGFSYVF